MSDAKFNRTEAHIKAPLDYYYKHNIDIPFHLGWKIITDDLRTGEQNSASGLLLLLQSIEKSNKEINFNYINAEVSFHNKHSHYTESTLDRKSTRLNSSHT